MEHAKIGVTTTDFYKKITGKSLEQLTLNELEKTNMKIAHWLNNHNLSCFEIGVKSTDALINVLRTFEKINYNYYIQVHDLEYSMRFSFIDESLRKEAVEKFLEMIDIASDYGIEIITIHAPCYRPLTNNQKYIIYRQTLYSLEYSSAYSHMIKLLKRVANYAKRKGVLIGLENLEERVVIGDKVLKSTHFGVTSNEILDIVRQVTPLRVTFDVGHANLTHEGVIHFLDSVHEYIINVHIHDNDGKRDLHAPLGKGNIKLRDVISKLKAYGYHRYLILERNPDSYLDNDLKILYKLVKGC